jgi:hypothetical protein
MSKLQQLHDRYGQSPWLDSLTRGDVTGDHPVWRRSGTDVFPGRHDEREER